MSFVLSMVLVLTGMTVPVKTVQATETTGECGEKLTWTLADGVLTIAGTGAMTDYGGSTKFPWYDSKDNITSVEIKEGVTSIADGAFYSYENLKSIQIPASLESIGEYAFMECDNLKDVDIAEGSELTSIGVKAFCWCTGLEEIEVPAGVTEIGTDAFFACGALQISVVSENTVYASRDGALYDKNMTTLIAAPGASGEFVIPSGVKNIDTSAFAYCSNLSSVKIPEGVESIGDLAFYDCSKLSSVEIPEGVESIGDSAFAYCDQLSSVEIPEGVTSIGSYAFRHCYQLSSVEIPTSVESIGNYAFEVCSNLSSVVILAKNVSGYSIFGEWTYVDTVLYPTDCTYSLSDLGLSDASTQISIADKEDGTVSLHVEKVSEEIANGTKSLTLPTDLGGKKISAISYAEGISKKSISISHAEHSFGNGTEACVCGYVPFTVSGNCTSVNLTYGSIKGEELSVSANTTFGTETLAFEWMLDDKAIDGATNKNYAIPVDLKAGDYNFSCTVSSNGYSQTVEIPVTVAKKQITIQADNKEKKKGEENPTLTYSVPEGVLVAGDKTADWTVSLITTATKDSAVGTYKITGTATSENYEITVTPGTLTVKAAQTTNPDDNSDTSKDEPQSGSPETPKAEAPKKGNEIKDVDNKAVYKVTKVGDTSGKVGTVEYVKPVKKSAKTVSIPSTITVDGIKYKVTSIASKAFKSNKYITKVTIGNNVKTIGSSAFYKCTKLKTVTIGNGVTTIKSKAFYGCKKLKTLTIKSTKLKTEKIGSKAFTKTPKSMTVKVPKKKFKGYKTMLLKKGVNKKAKFKKI